MASQVVTCAACGVGLRIPEVTVRSIFRCPKCKERVTAEPPPEEPLDEWVRVDESEEPGAPGQGALGALKGLFSRSGSAIKDALNISGVSMKLEGFPPALSDAEGTLKGSVVLTSGVEKIVHKLKCCLVGDGEIPGIWSGPDPLRIKAGETVTQAVKFSYAIKSPSRTEYPLRATCDVQGALRSVSTSVDLKPIGDVGLDLKFDSPTISRASHCAEGALVLSTHRDRVLHDLSCKLVMLETWDPTLERLAEKRVTLRGPKRRKETLVSEWVSREPFRIRSGEKRTVPFKIGFNLRKSMKEMDGVLGTIGAMASYVQNEADEYFLVATCSVQHGLVSPRVQRRVVLVP